MIEGKISIIVPVYKVEPYLRKCLDSIAGQTYENLEIILVDDGSPDRCGVICDEYAARDRRIRVIHQENGGLSAARNAALRIVTGEYIGFVDSDDWVEPEMFETMVRGLQETEADISVCGRWDEYKNRRTRRGWETPQTILDREQALGELLRNDKLQNHCWDKLFRAALWEGIVFPEGRTFEDIAVMHQLFLRAKRVVCLPNALYHYLQRPGSIIADISLKNRFNYHHAAEERYEMLREGWPQFAGLMEAQLAAAAVGIWAVYRSNPKEERQKYAAEVQRAAAFATAHRQEVMRYTSLGLAGRCVLRLLPYDTWWSFTLAHWVGRLYQWRHGRSL